MADPPGAPDTKQESYSSTFILYSNAAFREPASNPILPSPEPTIPDQPKATHPPISTLQMGRSATPFRGAPGNRCKRATHRRHPVVQCSIPGKGTISRPISMRLADRCFGPCGTAVRRLPGTPVGDTPICVGFRGARGKRSAVDAETWLNALSPSSNFEYLVIPHHHSGQLN
jgi:hypothetical protein